MYDIWFCPNYPIDIIQTSKTNRESRRPVWIGLAENIREHGLINPLVVLNHRPPHKYIAHACRQGLNRLEALKILGWSTVPAIVTGLCEYEPKIAVDYRKLQDYFPDGKVVWRGQGECVCCRPHISEVVLPETFEYPEDYGAYKHKDYVNYNFEEENKRLRHVQLTLDLQSPTETSVQTFRSLPA